MPNVFFDQQMWYICISLLADEDDEQEGTTGTREREGEVTSLPSVVPFSSADEESLAGRV